MSLALDPSLLALAVVTAAVRSLHNAGGTTSMATMTMLAIAARVRVRHSTAWLVHEHSKEDGDGNEGGETEAGTSGEEKGSHGEDRGGC